MTDYMRASLDDTSIELLIALLRRGHRFSTGDRGRKQLAFNGLTFTSSMTDGGSAETQAEGMNEAQLRDHLTREPRRLYDAFLVDSLVREGHAALTDGDPTLARARFESAMRLNYKTWAPHMGLALTLADDPTDAAREHLRCALTEFLQPLYHYALLIGLNPRALPTEYARLMSRVIAIDDRCALAYSERADARDALGEEEGAASDRARAEALKGSATDD